jgi:Tc5 transposase DNA-binding domain
MDQASRAVRLVDRGQFRSVRQVSRATDVARSTIQDRRAGRQPRGQEAVKHARLTRYQEEVLAKYIQNTQLQYAPVNRAQLHVVAEMLAQLNEPNARLGKNWLSRFLDRHPDLKTARNRGLDSKRITAAIPSQIEGWFAHVDDVVQRFNIHPHRCVRSTHRGPIITGKWFNRLVLGARVDLGRWGHDEASSHPQRHRTR